MVLRFDVFIVLRIGPRHIGAARQPGEGNLAWSVWLILGGRGRATGERRETADSPVQMVPDGAGRRTVPSYSNRTGSPAPTRTTSG